MSYSELCARLRVRPRRWLVTGAAGFIGSNLVEALLHMGQEVVGLDNFSTGFQQNLDEIRGSVSGENWGRFDFLRGDIREIEDCRKACQSVDIVLHQAALGSVPRSIDDPIASHASNVTGFLNMLVAAKESGVGRFVYAASSSTYGDHPGLPRREGIIGRPLSPYAVTKYANELYAEVFARCYGFSNIGLRYFNVFGRRQNPDGAYAAVIPKWVAGMIRGESLTINGDGRTSRDFCYIENVVQANILAATVSDESALNEVYNIAVGAATTLDELMCAIRECLVKRYPYVAGTVAAYGGFRAGDVSHSVADISKARANLGYEPTHTVARGLVDSVAWYAGRLG